MNPDNLHDGDARNSQSFVRALARGLAVMQSLGGHAKGRTLSDVASACSLDRATARRLLLTLEELGYVRIEDGRHTLTPRALSLGYAYLSSVPFWDVARPLMTKLAIEVQSNCSAATLDGPYAVYVARIRSNPHIVDVSRTVGSRVPAYCTSLGRVLLAAEPESRRLSLLQALPLERHTPNTVIDLDELMAIIARVEKDGWSLVNQELEPNLCSLAVPIRDQTGKVVASLNISTSEAKVSAQEFLSRCLAPLQNSACALTDALRERGSG